MKGNPMFRLRGGIPLIVVLTFLCCCEVRPDEKPRVRNALNGITGSPLVTMFNINNFTSFYRADGQGNHQPDDQSGGRFPRNTASCIYEDGFVWGAKLYRDSAYTQRLADQFIRVGGQTYYQGTRQGAVIGFGATAIPTPPTDSRARIYRIRRDYFFMSDAEVRSDAATLNLIPETQVSQGQMQAVRDQYAMDWTSWPVDLGAPYIERNGVAGFQTPPLFSNAFTPDHLVSGRFDEPGIAGAASSPPADQVIWTVYNDLDSVATMNLYASKPIGLEGQFTAWGYKRAGPLGDMHFKRLRLINKGGVNVGGGVKAAMFIDSMFVSMWSDPDLGDSGDDLCGSDTVLSLGYAYNNYAWDSEYRRFGLPPPAVGYILLEGPLVPTPGDSGIFGFRRIRSRRNVPLTAFAHYAAGPPIGGGVLPPGEYESTIRLYRMMRGFRPDHSSIPERYYAFPPGLIPGPFSLSGDPVTRTGFIDGLGTEYSLSAGDRRILLSSGPFRMAPGDTQDIVVAQVGGLGNYYLQSITELESSAKVARQLYNGFFQTLPPSPEVDVEFPSVQSTRLRISANAKGLNVTAMTAIFKDAADATVLTAQLYDDGMHGDGAANDGVFGEVAAIVPQHDALHLDIRVAYANSLTMTWQRLAESITTIGPLRVVETEIVSDNLNSDGIANEGENIRYGITLANGSNINLSNIKIFPSFSIQKPDVLLPALNAQTSLSMLYDPNNPTTYFSFDATPTIGSIVRIVLYIQDDHGNHWLDSVAFPVRPLTYEVHGTNVFKLAGKGDGLLDVSVVDLAALKPHRYVANIVDSINAAGDRGILLKDVTDGRILLSNHPLPDSLGHVVPVTDGFKLRMTGVFPIGGMKDWRVPSGTRRFTWADADSFRLDGFQGAIGWEDPAHLFGRTPAKAVSYLSLRNVQIKLAEARSSTDSNGRNPYGGWNRDTTTAANMSYAYRYLQNANAPPARPEFAQYLVNAAQGFAYQDYKKGVPFSAWDNEANPPKRLAVGFLENNVAEGLVDGKWWPPSNGTGITNTSSSGPREWFFVFDREYTGATPDTSLQKDILNNSLPVMWLGTVNRRGGANFSAGDEFLIIARHMLSSQDAWTFSLDSIVGKLVPEDFALSQNYPNPFNPTTTINYQLPTISHVTIKVYNILGQEVATLLNTEQILGFHSVQWNSTNTAGNHVASGVYFYRIEATSLTETSKAFTQTKKMLMLR